MSETREQIASARTKVGKNNWIIEEVIYATCVLSVTAISVAQKKLTKKVF